MTTFLIPDAAHYPNAPAMTIVQAGELLSVTNPLITEDQIRAYAIAGQLFSCSTGDQTNSATGRFPCSFFNPTANSKNVLLLSCLVSCANTGTADLFQITADPAYGTNPTALNRLIGGAASSLSTSIGYTTTTMTLLASSVLLEHRKSIAQSTIELLAAAPIYLPKGAAGAGVGVTAFVSPGAASTWSIDWMWLEV